MAIKCLEIFCDGGARGNPGPGASAFVVVHEGRVIYKDSFFLGVTTNNIAEYHGVVAALFWLAKNLKRLKKKNVFIFLDSELVVNQLTGKYKIKSKNLQPYFYKIKSLEKKLTLKIFYKYIPRNKNKLADYLVNRALDKA